VKRAYKDNPLFSDSKVVYSIYNDDFSEGFRKDFDKKIKLPGITAKDLKYYKDANYVSLTKAAIEYADAVILGSEKINPELEAYVNTLNKPVLPLQPADNYIDAYNNFYDSLLKK